MKKNARFFGKNSATSLLTATCAALLVAGCGKKSESGPVEEEESKVAADLKLQLYGVNGSSSVRSTLNLNSDTEFAPSCGVPYRADFGVSGAPESLKVKLKTITLKSTVNKGPLIGAPTTLFKSASANGVEVALNNGKIDLSRLTFEKELIEGVYDQIEFVFINGAEVSGCLEEDVADNTSSNCKEGEANAGKCDYIAEGRYSFCTRSKYKVTDIFGKKLPKLPGYVDFKDGSAEKVVLPLLSKFNPQQKADFFNIAGDYKLSVSIPPLQVGDGGKALREGLDSYMKELEEARKQESASGSKSAPTAPKPTKVENALVLSVLVDMNVLLTFNMNTRNDGFNGIEPLRNDLQDAAYFRLQDLSTYMTAFVGEPKSIEGYLSYHCYQFQNENRVAKNWITFAFDKDGRILAGSTVPFDNAGFVAFNGEFAPASAKTTPSVKKSDGTYDIFIPGYNSQGQPANVAHIKGFQRAAKTGDSQIIPKEKTNTTRLAPSPGSAEEVKQATVETIRLL